MYPLIITPTFANKDFFDFSKIEAKEYLSWFLSIKAERLNILQDSVSQLYPEWKLNFTKESLKKLYEWFKIKIAYRPSTENEKNEVKVQISKTPEYVNLIPIPQSSFTSETVAICFDIGLYFGETLISNIPQLKWFQKLTSTSYIDYAQPLVGKKESRVPINPRAYIEGIAGRILDKDDREITFEELFTRLIENFSK